MTATTWLYGTNARLAQELRRLLDGHTDPSELDGTTDQAPLLLHALARGLAGRDAYPDELVGLTRGGLEQLERLLMEYHRERLMFLDRSFQAHHG